MSKTTEERTAEALEKIAGTLHGNDNIAPVGGSFSKIANALREISKCYKDQPCMKKTPKSEQIVEIMSLTESFHRISKALEKIAEK